MNCPRLLAALLSALCLLSLPAIAKERDDDREDRDDRKADPALVAARQKFFGIENVDERGRVDKGRSEEHTSELQSRLHLVCRLLLEKKKKERKVMRTYKTIHTDLGSRKS